MTGLLDAFDLLGAYEQSEIALEMAMKDYQTATARLQQAKPIDRRQASYRLNLAIKEVLRQRAHHIRLQAEIAYARRR
jgi:hypothetical protein